MTTPWHLWVIGLAALLFNAGGAFDYVMTQTRNAVYMAQFSAEELAFFDAFPPWIDAFWATAVWGAVLGAVLLLLRSRHAVVAFGVAVLAMAVTFGHNFFVSDPPMHRVVGVEAVWVSLTIVALSFVWLLYAAAMVRRGVLR